LLPHLPPARELIAGRGYDSRCFHNALLPARPRYHLLHSRSRKVPIPHEAILYHKRHRIEIMFGRLKDWRRIASVVASCDASPILELGQEVLALVALAMERLVISVGDFSASARGDAGLDAFGCERLAE